MARLFSYVVHHDHGYAPCPRHGYCSLAKCKFSDGHRKNVVELAEVGDWIVGTGGADMKVSAGRGKIVYAMRVEEKLPFERYAQDRRFRGRPDADMLPLGTHGEFALVSRHFFYFGRGAISIGDMPNRHLDHSFEKKGPGYRSDFTEEFIRDFADWLEGSFAPGAHGRPCKEHSWLPFEPEAPARSEASVPTGRAVTRRKPRCGLPRQC